MEAVHDGVHQTLLLGHHALGDLNVEKIVRNLIGADVPVHHGEDVAQQKVQTREVDGHGDGGLAALDRDSYAAADLSDHIAVQLMDAPGLLQHGDKGVRGQEAAFGIDPARQGLKAAKLPGDGADDGLVVNLYPAVFEGAVKVVKYILPQSLFHGGSFPNKSFEGGLYNGFILHKDKVGVNKSFFK